MSIYEDYTKNYEAGANGYQGTPYGGKDVFSRTNYVVGVGIDYKF
jgi:long-chain fatty acid transport protein